MPQQQAEKAQRVATMRQMSRAVSNRAVGSNLPIETTKVGVSENATITAADDTKLLELTKADLAELSEEHPGLFKELELSVSNRTSD